jgi:hypothetical protein
MPNELNQEESTEKLVAETPAEGAEPEPTTDADDSGESESEG